MLRKILSLCLVAVLLSTVAFASEFVELTSVFAAEETAETFDTTIYASTTDNPMEFLWVTQSETDGVVSQKIATISWTASAKTFTENSWVLAKINVGENKVFDSMAFTARINMVQGSASSNTSTVYCIPLSYTDYNSAKAIAGDTSASLNNLVKPAAGVEGVVNASLTKSATNTTQGIKVTLDADKFNDGSAYYHDGSVYVAFCATGDNTSKLAVKNQYSNWKLAISGTIVTPAVTDFSDSVITWDNGAYTVKTATASGTAMLIAASFNATTMVDAKVATIDATTAADGVISGTISDLEAGTSVKVFLWANNTLVPAIAASDF